MTIFLVFWNDLYHLKSRWRNSDVLVYQGPLQIATFWEWLANYFHYGVYQAASCSCWYSTSTAAIRSRSCELADSPKTARSNAAIPQLSWTNPPGSWRSVWKIKNGKKWWNTTQLIFWGRLPKVVFFFHVKSHMSKKACLQPLHQMDDSFKVSPSEELWNLLHRCFCWFFSPGIDWAKWHFLRG